MGKYGEIAIKATESIQNGEYVSPSEAWIAAALKEFDSKSSQEKSCLKGAYLGLCESGSIKCVPVGKYCKSTKNKGYAIKALSILKKQPNSVHTAKELWMKVLGAEEKVYNQQMDVVLTLWDKGYINV